MTLIFNRNFDDERRQEAGEIPTPCGCDKPTQEQVDALIEAAKVDAFEAGREEGYSNALQKFHEESDQIQSAALADVQTKINDIFKEINQHNAALEAQVLDFSLSICEQVFPYLQQSQSHERALLQIQKTMRLTLNSPYINIILSNDALPKLTPFIEKIAHELGVSEQIKIGSDQNLKDGATLVEWQNGFMTYSFDTVCERIFSALKAAQSTIVTPLINGSEESA